MKTKLLLIVLTALVMLSCSPDEETRVQSEGERYYVQVWGQGITSFSNCSPDVHSPYNIEMKFTSGNTEVHSEHFNFNINQWIQYKHPVQGNLIGVVISLTDFDPQNIESGLSSGFKDIRIEVYDNTQIPDRIFQLVVNKRMIICYTSYPKIVFTYNIQTEEYEIEQLPYYFD